MERRRSHIVRSVCVCVCARTLVIVHSKVKLIPALLTLNLITINLLSSSIPFIAQLSFLRSLLCTLLFLLLKPIIMIAELPSEQSNQYCKLLMFNFENLLTSQLNRLGCQKVSFKGFPGSRASILLHE